MKRLSELTGRCLVYRTGKEWEFRYVCRGKNQKRSFVLSEIALLFYTPKRYIYEIICVPVSLQNKHFVFLFSIVWFVFIREESDALAKKTRFWAEMNLN